MAITEKLTEQLLESTLNAAKHHSWPELFSDNYHHLCESEAQLCVVALGKPDESLVDYAEKTKKLYQFTYADVDLHSFPEAFHHKVVVINGITNNVIGFANSEKAISFLEKYSAEDEEDDERWESGVEIYDFLRYRGYTPIKEIAGMVFSWGGFAALTLIYVSSRILF